MALGRLGRWPWAYWGYTTGQLESVVTVQSLATVAVRAKTLRNKTMVKYRVAVALLCGAGFTSLLVILIKLSMPSGIALLLSLLLLPGSAVAHLAVGSREIGPPPLVLAANAIVYAVVLFVGLSIFARGVAAGKIRLAAAWLVLPVVILTGLVCIPALNPLWPRGMMELTRQEKGLQDALPVGMGMDGARVVLRSKGIQFQEETETSQAVVLEQPDRSITAAVGDRVISARLETEASQFPCGYDIQVVLLFGPDEIMKDRYVHRLRLCP